MLKLADASLLKSAHDCSDGGLAVAIAECCFSSLKNPANGAQIELSNAANLSAEALLFGETQSRIVISFEPETLEKVEEIIGDLPFEVIGRVAGENLTFKIGGEEKISASVSKLENAWKTSLESQLEN